jgi:hypothetical protein
MQITVSSEPGSAPMVDGKQTNNQRRYVVTNSSAITRVAVTPAAGGTVIFDPTIALPGGRRVIYTSVTVT